VNRHLGFCTNITRVVDRFAKNVHDSTQGLLADRYFDRRPCIGDGHASFQAFGRAHGNRANDAVAQLLLNFERDFRIINNQCVVNLWDLACGKLYVHNSANYLHSSSGAHA